MKRMFIVFAGILLLGCARGRPVILTVGARSVSVVSSVPTDMQCQLIAPVTETAGANFRHYDENFRRCVISVRNQAARMGATHLVLQNETLNSTAWSWGHSQCNNCVRVSGMAYRCR